MKLLIFGIGKYYQNRKIYFTCNCNDNIIALLDNNLDMHGKNIDGIPVISPCDINRYSYDKILLMSAQASAMKKQLIEYGVREDKIWYWEEYNAEVNHGIFKLYCGNTQLSKAQKNILIISTALYYNGGTLAAIYAAMALQMKGYNVVVAAPSGDPDFIKETISEGINVVICPVLPYIQKEEIFWIQQFDMVIVNVFQMILCAYEISKIKPVIWWIHESKTMFENILYQFSECAKYDALSNINIFAVSSIPRNNFNHFFPERIKNILSYGIPDRRIQSGKGNREKMVFAIIGDVDPRKAQDIFIQAINLLEDSVKESMFFWIIGSIGTDDYSNYIKDLSSKVPSVKILGKLTRNEIDNAYKEIDVVVCPSLEDPLPIVMTEGMMYGKICITSDANGTVDYIEDGKNGFICKSNDPTDLAKKMLWIINNKDKLQDIGIQARKTYEKYFTLEKFGDRLESALLETIDTYNSKVNKFTENPYVRDVEKDEE
ncbi:spore coat protein SA [Lachnospiraceae bacterium]|nr:spore coat protein SA [Lachnospiraceae bacterium]